MSTTYCETCFPDWDKHEVLTIVPRSPCRCCGRTDQPDRGVVCHLFRGDPFPAANAVAERVERMAQEAGINRVPDDGRLAAMRGDGWGGEPIGMADLRRFAALVAEECAKEAEHWAGGRVGEEIAQEAPRTLFRGMVITHVKTMRAAATRIRALFPPAP